MRDHGSFWRSRDTPDLVAAEPNLTSQASEQPDVPAEWQDLGEIFIEC